MDNDKLLNKNTLHEIIRSIKPGILANKIQTLYDRGEISVQGWDVLDSPKFLEAVFEDEEAVEKIRDHIRKESDSYLKKREAYMEFERRLRAYGWKK